MSIQSVAGNITSSDAVIAYTICGFFWREHMLPCSDLWPCRVPGIYPLL